MKALTFELYLLEPLLATRLGGGDPNSAVGFEYIPGSMVRGMVIARYRQKRTVDAADATFRRIFLDGHVRFLNAYPQVLGERALPTPLSWRVEKDNDKPIYDFAMEAANSDRQWKNVKQPFCYLWQDDEGRCKTELCSPNRQISIHTARGNRQRTTEGESTVFRYEAISPEQTFCGVILAEEENDLTELKKWMPEGSFFSLGGSHLAGYGQVRLKNVMIQDDWQEYKPIENEIDRIIVTLLSDVSIRDPRTGAYVTTLEPVLGQLPKEEAFINTHVVGGFNRKWNLPLPQTLAIQAGSVFVYPANQGLLERLHSLVNVGIGERLAEGFGRIAVNWHAAAEIFPVDKSQPIPPMSFVLKDGACIELAQKMVLRMLREQLDQKLVVAVNGLKMQHPPNIPSNAQLSRMRIVARQAFSEKKPQILIQHLGEMKKAAKDQFQRAWIGNQRLDEWLHSRAGNVQSIWQYIKMDQKPNIGGIEPDLEALALEYTIRLIDGLLRKTLKEAAQ
jgi:CRISPR-associated protein Csx10